jgi:ribulose 1,5-bisphosphate carboxylase large subunit-like protein
VLKYAYRAGSGLTSTPIGIQPIGAASEQIIDVDVSGLVLEHTAYKKRLSEILSQSAV